MSTALTLISHHLQQIQNDINAVKALGISKNS